MSPFRTLVLAVVAVALLAGASRGPAASVPRIPVVREKGGPLLGIAFRSQVGVLARLDPRSLQLRKGPRLVLGEGITSWAFSSERSRLVVAREAGRSTVLRFVSSLTLAPLGRVVTGPGWAQRLTWLEPSRLLVLQVQDGGCELVVVDPTAQRVVSRRAVPGDVVAVERASDRLVLLLAPHGRIGVAMLAVADAEGNLRTVALDRTYAGSEGSPDGSPGTPVPHHRLPGLAVDPTGRRAIVVGAGEPAAEVSLDSLTVTYHSLAPSASLLSRLHEWLEPAALAKGMDGPTRSARWLGNGLVAVTGADERIYDNADGRQFSWTPSGLELLDTGGWSLRTLARGADSFSRAGAGLLATGTTSDSVTGTQRAIGLAGYGQDGALRFRALKGQDVYVEVVHGTRAYVRAERSGDVVVDTRTGRIVGPHAADLPWVLIGDGG